VTELHKHGGHRIEFSTERASSVVHLLLEPPKLGPQAIRLGGGAKTIAEIWVVLDGMTVGGPTRSSLRWELSAAKPPGDLPTNILSVRALTIRDGDTTHDTRFRDVACGQRQRTPGR